MGLFDMFGKGGGDLTIERSSTDLEVKQVARGTAVFAGGKREQKIEGLQVWFVRENEGGTDDILGMSGPKKIPLSDVIKPGDVKRYDFEIEVPNYSTHTLNAAAAKEAFGIRASLDIPKELDPSAKLPVKLRGGIVAEITTSGPKGT